MALLEVEDLHVAYGKIEAVKGISFSVEAGLTFTNTSSMAASSQAWAAQTSPTLSSTVRILSSLANFLRNSSRSMPNLSANMSTNSSSDVHTCCE